MAAQHQLTTPMEGISCHAWNHDYSMLAICPNNNEIHIYGECKTANWKVLHVLREHDLLVTSIDWSHAHNKIVSCSHDRNAFVWDFNVTTSEWKPALVILRIDRAALDIKWSVDGSRFAVGSGSKCISVCSYEEKNLWWVSKMVKKKIKSSVLAVAFHPTNCQVLATASSDFKCRIYSTHNPEIDGPQGIATPFTSPIEFGEIYCELSCTGWVVAVAWSPDGLKLCYAGQDSSLNIASGFSNASSTAPLLLQTIRISTLPLASVLFVSNTAIIGAGYDFIPFLFGQSANESEWKQLTGVSEGLDPGTKKASGSSTTSTAAAGGAGGVGTLSNATSARNMFQNRATKGQDTVSDSLHTQHENYISTLRLLSTTPTRFSTSAQDGRIVLWDLNRLIPPEVSLANLSIS